MDLHTVREWTDVRDAGAWRPDDAWVAGGTSLFSAPAPHLRRLVDLGRTGWEPLVEHGDGRLEIAATCTVARIAAYPVALFGQCCRAFLASFKIWNEATVGGNLCAALPAGPMIALTAALDGECLLLGTDGTTRTLPVTAFVVGAGRTALREGELLRSVTLAAVPSRTAFRQASLSTLGRSAALLVGTRDDTGATALTVTAATPRPLHVRFSAPPTAADVREALGDAVWFDDLHGDPAGGGISPSGSPRRSDRSSRRERLRRRGPVHELLRADQRRGPGRRAAPGAVPADLPARARLLRGQEGLRRR